MTSFSLLDFALCLALLHGTGADGKKIKNFCKTVKMENPDNQHLVSLVLHSSNRKEFIKQLLRRLGD